MSGKARRKRSRATSLGTTLTAWMRGSGVSLAASARASASGCSVITTAAGSPDSGTESRERFFAIRARSPGT